MHIAQGRALLPLAKQTQHSMARGWSSASWQALQMTQVCLTSFLHSFAHQKWRYSQVLAKYDTNQC